MLTFNVLTDFSAAGSNALRYVVLLTRHVMSRVHLVHVLPTPTAPGAEFFRVAGPALTLQEAAHKLAARAQEMNRYVPCSYEVVTDAPAQVLPRILSSSPLSVTVVGSNHSGRTLAEHWLSTALYLVRTCPQPLLVVPAAYQAGEAPHRIVFDTDGRSSVSLTESARPLTELLYRLTRRGRPLQLSASSGAVDALLTKLIPTVVGIHIYTAEHGPAEAEVADQIGGSGLLKGVAYTIQTNRHYCVEEGILRTAAQQRAELLAFVTRQLTFAGPEFYESITARLLLSSSIPVLTVPEATPSPQPWDNTSSC